MRFDPRKFAIATAGFCAFLNLYSPQALLPALANEFGVGAAEISTIMTASALAIALTRRSPARSPTCWGASASSPPPCWLWWCLWRGRRWRPT